MSRNNPIHIGLLKNKRLRSILFRAAFLAVLVWGINLALNSKRNTIFTDAEGYHMYLPAWFIHKNFKDLSIRSKKVFRIQEETGNYYTKFSMGVAMAEAPMFLLTDMIQRKIYRHDWQGSEMCYSRSIGVSGWLAFLTGMFFLIRWLSRSHGKLEVWIGAISIALGTNLWYYATREPGMSHIYSFMLFSIAAFLMDGCYRANKITWAKALIIGFIGAWMILIRPTNAIFLLFLLLYSPAQVFKINERISFLLKHWSRLIPFLVFAALLWAAQIYQWSIMRGDQGIYSYTNEGFIYWANPKILRVLLDVQNGLLIYSPVIWISLYGLLRYFNEKAATSRLILGVFFVMTWIFASWWAWWFGGAYGHRCYVEFYVILAIPLVWVVEQVNRSKSILSQVLFYSILLLMIYYSVGLTNAYLGPWDGPNWNWTRFSEIVSNLFALGK